MSQAQRKNRNLFRRCTAILPKALILFPAAFVCFAGLSGRTTFSQQPPNSKFDAQARSRDILAHLNSVIQFYRTSTQPIQKAGEPNDIVYSDQATLLSSQIAGFAFQSAKAEAALMAGYQARHAASADPSSIGEQQRTQSTEERTVKQISDLQAREAALEKQIAAAKPRALAALQAQRKQVQDALDLTNAMKDALQKIVGISNSREDTGLAADIDRLQGSVPELQSKNKIFSPQLMTLESARSAGVTSQGRVLFELFETRHSLDTLLGYNNDLHKQALDLRTPLSDILRNTIQQGQLFSQQAEGLGSSDPQTINQQQTSSGSPSAAQPNIQSITARFNALSAATVPLSQEIIVLEQSHANLTAWQTSAEREYKSILHALLLRILVIAIALLLIIGGGEVWTRATNKYVRDIRRRRQLLIVRRIVIGFLSIIVILFGFVTQFNSLATFAGFITAGIAVGLQTILLSVAAYFFIIGRYGVKVGDRITISSVTGDVIDVGLVRFYMMELAGNGTELNPTGRVAVFSNAVLFQAGTPLYKQMPGTEYAWHELIIKLADNSNYKTVCEAVMTEVHKVYEEYRTAIEEQHRGVENWMQASIDPPTVESRLQFNGGAFQLWARFPVEIRQASETDEKLTQALFDLITENQEIKDTIASTPTIQASVRGRPISSPTKNRHDTHSILQANSPLEQ
jgi:small-conductance mechanosensitive channel